MRNLLKIQYLYKTFTTIKTLMYDERYCNDIKIPTFTKKCLKMTNLPVMKVYEILTMVSRHIDQDNLKIFFGAKTGSWRIICIT